MLMLVVSGIYIAIIYLFTAHYVADFSLQGSWMSENKSKYWYILFTHSFIYSGVVSIVLIHLGMFQFYQFPLLFLSHYFIDRWKCKQYHPILKSDRQNLKYLYIDQTLHFIILIIILIFYLYGIGSKLL